AARERSERDRLAPVQIRSRASTFCCARSLRSLAGKNLGENPASPPSGIPWPAHPLRSLAVERLTATGPHRRSDSNPVPRNMRAGISLSEAFCGPRGLYRLMASLSALLDNVVDGAETVMLVAPNSSYYERSLDVEDV